jgi:hypothetical protein
MKKAALALILAPFLLLACGQRGVCRECAQYAPPPPSTYDLILTEAASGAAGISTGQGVAFMLDARRDHLITSPVRTGISLDYSTLIAGKRVFTLVGGQYGVFEVTATGPGMAPFTFHITIGRRLPFLPRATVLRPGDLIVQEYPISMGPSYESTALGEPGFQLVQDVVSLGAAGELLKSSPAPARRAYRAVQPGSHAMSSSLFKTFLVVVADAPPAFQVFVDGGTPAEGTISTAAGDRLAVVLAGDGRQLSWTAVPVGALVRLSAVEVAPQPRGATLIPFRVMVEGRVSLEFHAIRPAMPAISVSIQSGQDTCLPDDFPRYSLAQTTSTGGPPCLVYMASTDSTARIQSFYRAALNQGDWRLGTGPGPIMGFWRRSNPSWGGTVEVAAGVITIRTIT